RGCSAALDGGNERPVERAMHRGFQICVIKYHQRILATHLELYLGAPPGGFFEYPPSGLDRTGEADRTLLRRSDDCFADHGAPTHHEIEDACRQSSSRKNYGKRPRA